MKKALIVSLWLHLIVIYLVHIPNSEAKTKNNARFESNLIYIKEEKVSTKEEKVEVNEDIIKEQMKKFELAKNLNKKPESTLVNREQIKKKENIKTIETKIIEEKKETTFKIEEEKIEYIKVEKAKVEVIEKKEEKPIDTDRDKSVKEVEEIDISLEGTDEKAKKNSKLENNKDFVEDTDGSYIAINPSMEGLNIMFKNSPQPDYPSKYKKIRLRRGVVVETSFIVDLNGRVEKISFHSNAPVEFKVEVEKALKTWTFEPIYYLDENVKVKFYKNFVFR